MSHACLHCGDQLPQGRTKFCSPECSRKWHNDAQTRKEREDPLEGDKRRAQKRARYHADPEHYRQQTADWRKTHPEEQKAIERRRREQHGDVLRARCRAAHHADKARRNAKRLVWHQEHKTEANSKRLEHYFAHRDEAIQNRKDTRKNHRLSRPWLHLYNGAKQRAQQNGHEFSLTHEWAEQTWTGYCAVSKISFGLTDVRQHPFSPSIDRIDPLKGYTPENCRFVLMGVNALKGRGTDADMMTIARAILENFTLRP